MRRRLSRHTRHSLLIEEGAEEVDIWNDDRNISTSDDIDPELASLMDKYNLFFINGRRYYEFDMTTKLPVLENTIPYLFRYKDIEIYESRWNKMAVRIVEELDKLYPKSESYLLNLQYWRSKTEVFSSVPRKNFSAYKNIFLNTNHTSTHAMMSIQCLLEAFGVSPSTCYFVIRKHPIAESYSVRTYFKNKTINGFKKCMAFRGFPQKRVATVVNNFKVINQLLGMVSQGYDDFFLFDEYYNFLNYKIRVIQKAKDKFVSSEKNIEVTIKTLNRLDEYYKNQEFYDAVTQCEIDEHFKTELKEEIDYLFESLNTSVITIGKLYARMSIVHADSLDALGHFNNQADLFRFVTAYFEKDYYYKKPFISKDKEIKLENDDLIVSYVYDQDEISVTKVNNYANKMHLKKLTNYLTFFVDISDDYVQVDQERAIRKEVFDLDEDKLDKIEKELIYYIKSFGSIDSETFAGYSSLPNIGRMWNKYLLLGVVRSYLNDTFKIDYSNGTYKTFTFTINLL